MAGLAAGTAAVWAAPAITTLGSRAFAAGTPAGPVVLDFADDAERTGIPSGTQLSDFGVIGGNIDVVGGATYPELSDGTIKVADLDGTSAMTAKLQSNVTFGPGTFRVTYRVSGSRRPGVNGDSANTIMVSLGSGSDSQTIPAASGAPADYSFTTTLAGPAPVIVSHESPDGSSVGNLLYSVTVLQLG